MARQLQRHAVSASKCSTCCPYDLPPLFLAPFLLNSPIAHFNNSSPNREFSSTPRSHAKLYKQKDGNPKRGVSVIRRTGPKTPLAMQRYALPQPRPASEAFPTPKEHPSKNHGLMSFFPDDGKAMATPESEGAFGRSWTYLELVNKSWEDLHRLWWVCAKEKNRISTGNWERRRIKAGFGDWESKKREAAVQETQNQIRKVLANRWHSWNVARDLWQKGERAEEEEEGLEEADVREESTPELVPSK
ncbi:MAG: hypothetical protein Q9227_005543 [Pyrenula ochraceoflavens]